MCKAIAWYTILLSFSDAGYFLQHPEFGLQSIPWIASLSAVTYLWDLRKLWVAELKRI